MRKLLLAAVLGGLTLFVWGTISWVVLPWHNATLHPIPNEQAVVDGMKSTLPKTGVYLFPAMPLDNTDAAMKAYEEKMKAGPRGMIMYTAEGSDLMPPSTFIYGFIFFFLSALLAAVLLSLAGSRLRTYTTRVFFVTILGIVMALDVHLGGWNWMGIPPDYTVVMALDSVLAWFLTGLVLAAVIKPKAEAAAA